MNRGAWGATVHGVTKSWTRLSDFHMHKGQGRYSMYIPTTSVIKTVSAAAAAKSLQSCPTLCEPIDGNLPGSAVPGILQARTLEWVAISFSNA